MNLATRRCPLCLSQETNLQSRIRTEDLVNLYMESYGFDVSYLFGETEISYYICAICGLEYFDPSFIGDQQFYEMLQTTKDYYLDEKQEYDFASTFVRASDKVLEVGCGKAVFSRKIVAKGYTGLEYSANAKTIAVNQSVTILNESITDHSLVHTNHYDVVCCFQVLEHIGINELRAFIGSSVRALKKRGVLIVSVPSADSFVSKIRNCTLNLPPHHQTRWHDKTLSHLSTLFDLKILEWRHDQISERNKYEYLNVVINDLFYSDKLVQRNNLIVKINNMILAKLSQKVKKKIIQYIRPRGHSVTFIYRK